MKKIIAEIDKLKDKIIEIRRHIHMYPDLSGEEYPTRDYVKEILQKEGIKEIRTFENHAGMVVDIIAGDNLPTIAFRADMDALPIKEENNVPYKSRKQGVMHACGHDGHTAILTGFLIACNRHKDKLPFNIRGIFQHKEEVMDGGSEDLIRDGALDGVSAIFGLHMYPYLKTGEIGYKYGEMMASADMFEIEIFGKSAHGARPHEGVDAILTASMVVNSINHIVSRRIDPLHPAVISFGTIEGGKAANIICDHVKLSGTVRTLNDSVRQNIKEMMEEATAGICRAMGAKYNFHYYFGNPELINDDKMVDVVIKAAKKFATPIDLRQPVMGGEDFANYLKVVKGAFFRLGCCNENKATCYPQHHPRFDIDEDSLIIGAKIFANILKELK
ncbi:amidohydrolase [Caminibacter pacificus]|uniref:Amidohydrolase n=1 Tax=Caminibacter pacificus TaxID=1424653 RepID=A0AAJ4RE43_9BACT|nr:amidohydrolase [Caminibacter pacificus]NPA87824.1 amidohydrolase [Campylobacterota bacterium]QCI28161.1 amidohydrolase [Caminibacter pacificus]ROR41127.1 amidohydrolase [Caminibacter pacificus]